MVGRRRALAVAADVGDRRVGANPVQPGVWRVDEDVFVAVDDVFFVVAWLVPHVLGRQLFHVVEIIAAYCS